MVDLIDRQAAIEKLTSNLMYMRTFGADRSIDLIEELPSAQPSATDTNVSGNMIDRQAAIDALRTCYDTETISMDNGDEYINYGDAVGAIEQLPTVQPEPLTDDEQRIFLAAMAREEQICKKVDDDWKDYGVVYEDSLVRTCHEITRKVKGALWT